MKIRLIDELNIATTQGYTNRFDDDSYVGIIFYVKAQKAGSVITSGVVGNVRVNYAGDDIVNAPYSVLSKYADLLFGKPRSHQGAAGEASYYGCFIPFYHPSLPNAIHKEINENLGFYIDKAQESVDTAVCYVYGIIDDLPELYTPRLVAYRENADTGTKKILLDQSNVTCIMLTAPTTTDPNLIQLLIDNDLKYSGSWQILEDLTNVLARIESTSLDVVYLDMVQKGEINETLSDEATLLVTGGSGAFYYLVQSLKFNATKTIRTAIKTNAIMNNKLQTKINREGAKVSIIRNPANKSPEIVNKVNKELENKGLSPGLSPGGSDNV